MRDEILYDFNIMHVFSLTKCDFFQRTRSTNPRLLDTAAQAVHSDSDLSRFFYYLWMAVQGLLAGCRRLGERKARPLARGKSIHI